MGICGGRARRRAARRKGYLFREGASGRKGMYAVVVPSLDLIIVNRLDGDLTKREIHKSQISRMVEMVVAAAPAN